MKLLLSTCCTILFIFCPALAMAQSIGSAQTQVNVIIAQAQSIQVSQPTVNIQMTQTPHFISGSNSGQQVNHVKVTSNTGYQVTVKASTQFFSLNGSLTTLPVNTIQIKTLPGNDLTGSGAALPPAGTTITSPVMLSHSSTPLINANEGEGARGFHVTYGIPPSQVPSYLNRPAGTYTTTVVYTLIAQ